MTPQTGLINKPNNLNITFFDTAGALDSEYTVTWDWGDGTQKQETDVSYAAAVNTSHTYTASGIYTIKVTVTDNDGGIGGHKPPPSLPRAVFS
ncbi:MAG: PKD domain protein [Pelotomaculum sp. PtaB.Bin104]|nr:MAG: PKD domain protein [Pelotomaculum sp. PtaB.Bin104]